MSPPEELYASIHHISSLEQATVGDLRGIIRTYPVIDNHGHNLFVEKHASTNHDYPFELITSEANGVALSEDSPSTLAHMRAVKQLSELLNCPPTALDVKVARDIEAGRNYDEYTKKCLEGTHAILIDDGLKTPEGIVHLVRDHEKFVPRASRIVRIEKLAEEILEASIDWTGESKAEDMLVPSFSNPHDAQSVYLKPERSASFFSSFTRKFRQAIADLVSDPQVCGFKSVICYRTGLDIAIEAADEDLLRAWNNFLIFALKTGNFRLQCKEVNDFLVIGVCDFLSSRARENPENRLPFQFHTGLGDTDLNLLKANPAHMQTLVKAYPSVNFVLLHSAYPYTREAGYLAAHYSNVYLDMGEVFPMLSRDGQKSVLRQAMELVPTSKILWSTDGRFYPETYWLANKQFREVLEEVVLEYVENGDLTIKQGIDAAVNILFWNSNELYRLKEQQRYPELLQACGRRAELPHTITSVASQAQHTPASTPSDPAKPGSVNDLRIWDDFYKKNPSVKYIWVQFLDYTATIRQRMVPVAQFREHLRQRSYPAIPLAAAGLLQNDILSPGASSAGQFFIVPDLSTLALNHGIKSPSATVQTWWQTDSDIGEVVDGCPRSMLSRQVALLKDEFDIDILMGFEIEVIFMKPILNESGNDFIRFEPIHKVHSWSNMTTQQLELLPMIEEIVDTLNEAGIPIPQFHAESAPGQWEFPLPCYTPLKAVDTLYRARDIVRNVAKKHGLRATLYPRPWSNACGSASHVHFSINGPGARREGREDSFLAGVLEHLPAILAFTLPIEESYARVLAGIWAGGVYVTWGTQNKEVPLRKCGRGHWELKTIDGIGNAYLSMTALLAAGYDGLMAGMALVEKDCEVDASKIGDLERKKLGIRKMLPNTVKKAWVELETDSRLRRLLGDVFVERYLRVKGAERELLRGFGEVDSDKRRVWLMSRY